MSDIKDSDLPWRKKASAIIAKLSMKAYKAANSGKRGWKTPRPYTVPPIARRLVDCLDRNAEEEAKAIFVNIALNPECVNDP